MLRVVLMLALPVALIGCHQAAVEPESQDSAAGRPADRAAVEGGAAPPRSPGPSAASTEPSPEALTFDGLGRVNGFDTVEHYETSLRNAGERPVPCEVVEEVQGMWELASRQAFERDENRVMFQFELEPGQEQTLDYRLRRHHGERAKG